MTTPRKPARSGSAKKGQPQTVRVRRHQRVTKTGKSTQVRSHSRTISPGKQAAIAWAGAGVTGLTTLGLMLQAGFALLGVIFLLITLLLGVVAAFLTGEATKSRRRMRAKTRKRNARSRSRGRRR